jgi:hypothetical protein
MREMGKSLCESSCSTQRQAPVAVSHTRTVLSLDAEATSCPSGEKTTALTGSEWPSSTLRHASHSTSLPRIILTVCGTCSINAFRTMLASGEKRRADEYIWRGASASIGTNRSTNWLVSRRNLATALSDGYIQVSVKHDNHFTRNALPLLALVASPLAAHIDPSLSSGS